MRETGNNLDLEIANHFQLAIITVLLSTTKTSDETC
jgi:hypothetical protein